MNPATIIVTYSEMRRLCAKSFKPDPAAFREIFGEHDGRMHAIERASSKGGKVIAKRKKRK
jgi:hypothetical protein